jgi:hypothetical protein
MEMEDQDPTYTLQFNPYNCSSLLIPNSDRGDSNFSSNANNRSCNPDADQDQEVYVDDLPLTSLFHFIILGIGVSVVAILGK